jgi:lipopolysaccharide transport system ATP-binding protein
LKKDYNLKAENISQYRLRRVGTGTLSHDLNRWWHQIRRKSLSVEITMIVLLKGKLCLGFADINFEVERGEV